MRVLLVEDCAPLAEVLVFLLASVTAETIYAPDREEARKHLASGEPFDVVLCDVANSSADALRFFFWARMVRPELAGRFVFMTMEPRLPAAHIISTTHRVLRLPCTRDELADAIRKTRDEGSSCVARRYPADRLGLVSKQEQKEVDE